MVTDGFESKTWCICLWFFTLHFRSIPLRSVFEFRETGTGKTTKETCIGPGLPWFPGQTKAYCGHDWHHSSDVTGIVKASARVEHLVIVTGTWNFFYFAQSRKSDTKDLKVGEVLNVGQRISAPSAPPPPETEEDDGFCSTWGISVACWLVETTVDGAIEVILWAAPFLDEVVKFFDGCADGVLDAAGGLVDILKEIKNAITNPSEFVSEKLQEFKDLIAAIKEDPKAFAKEVLGDLAQVDRLDEEGLANWLGSMICTLAIEYFSGKAVASIIGKARKWLKDRRDNPDGPDRPDDPDSPNPNPCRISSFPGDTTVLMHDGSYTRIDQIRPGDQVMSHNVDTGVWEPNLVVDQWSYLDRGPPATATLVDNTTITATDDHLFWRASSNDWTELRHLRAADTLLTPAGEIEIANITVGPRHDWTVWELTVEGNHNFTVAAGDNDLLVHNRSCGEGIDDNKGKPIPGTTGKIGDKPKMTNDSPPRVIIDPGPPPVTRKPRAPASDNPDFDHSKTRTDPVTGETTYYRKDGSSVTYDADGFPKFDSEMDVYLNPDEIGSGSNTQDFGSANDKVRDSLANDPTLLDDFPQDVQDFYNQPTTPNTPPPGYTWHHHQDTGRMQLVPEGVHGDFPHTGGASIWGKK